GLGQHRRGVFGVPARRAGIARASAGAPAEPLPPRPAGFTQNGPGLIGTVWVVPHRSDVSFRVHHALRIKGFAKTDVIAELTALPVPDVEGELVGLEHRGLAAFREARALWQLTPDGRKAHAEALAKDVADPLLRDHLGEPYPTFLQV